MKPKVHSRRQYLINRQLQLSYAWLLILCVGLVIIIFGLSLWYVNKMHLSLFYSIVGEEALPKHYINTVQNQFLVGTIIAVAVVSGLLLILGIYASHRIAGPAYRITKNLNRVGVENEMDTIQVRKKDQLKEMADAFNHMVHALKDKMYQDMRLIDQVKTRIVQLHESLRGESLDIKKLSEQVKEIEKIATELRNRKYI
ncbi:MAG: methyl-accepting chemotaxis protein [Candidatus Omnitrophica bacterium]|nr:methyl-accepting chemotaxis protein [Candidatus Omnitrophota bacterium]